MKTVCALLLGVVGLAGCHRNRGGEDAPDEHIADARVLLGGFLKPGADQPALTLALRPKPEDYDLVFVPDAARKLRAELDPLWDGGKLVLKPKAEQSELIVASATVDELRAGTGSAECPRRYQEIADMLKAGTRIYCFRFHKPGDDRNGVRSDGLVWVKDHWAVFPKAFRHLGATEEAPAGSGQAAPAGSAHP